MPPLDKRHTCLLVLPVRKENWHYLFRKKVVLHRRKTKKDVPTPLAICNGKQAYLFMPYIHGDETNRGVSLQQITSWGKNQRDLK